jgi:molecular chaperone GrpE
MSEEKNNVIDIEIEDSEEIENSSPATDEVDVDENSVSMTEELPEQETKEDEQTEESIVSDYMNQVLRAQAELQNYKRRTEQRMQQFRDGATRDLIVKLLPVVDDFDILFDHHQNEDETISIKGVTMIYNKLMSTLLELGLEPIEAAGQAFDPNVHEAIMAEESNEVEEGKILKVWQRGFKHKDSLMRPAKVITAIAKSETGESNGK